LRTTGRGSAALSAAGLRGCSTTIFPNGLFAMPIARLPWRWCGLARDPAERARTATRYDLGYVAGPASMKQYLDLMRQRARSRAQENRPHRHRHAVHLRLADAIRPSRRVSSSDHQESASSSRSSTSCSGSSGARPTSTGCRSAVSRSGTSGPTRTASSGRCTVRSGAAGPLPTGRDRFRSRKS